MVFGLHAVRHLLESQAEQAASLVEELLLQAGREDERLSALRDLAQGLGVVPHEVPRRVLDGLVRGRHQGVVLRLRERAELSFESLLEQLTAPSRAAPLLLILDGVQDPHNLGACLRVANGAAVDAVVVPRHRAVGLTATTRKVACGAAESTPLITVTNLARALTALQEVGVNLIGADDQAPHALWDVTLQGPTAIVMGGEAKGLRRLTREACDTLVHLPMAGVVESLNVSVAAGVCLFEVVRQRRGQTKAE